MNTFAIKSLHHQKVKEDKSSPYGEEFPNLKYPLPLTFGCNLST